MSIEQNIQALTAAINQMNQNLDVLISLAAKGVAQDPAAAQQVSQQGMQAAAPVQQAAAVTQQPAQQAVAQTPVAAPFTGNAAPTFAQPAQQQQAVQLPFNDINGLVQYTMATYQQLGPQKGAAIQGILTNMGVGNINDIKPEQFAQFYQAVEQLKNS